MTRKTVVVCDAGCGGMSEDRAGPHTEPLTPTGWIVLYGPHTGSVTLHFDTWVCLARYAIKHAAWPSRLDAEEFGKEIARAAD